MCNSSTQIIVIESTISKNIATSGAGIYSHVGNGGSLSVSKSLLEKNGDQNTENGGGIYCKNTVDIIQFVDPEVEIEICNITNSMFKRNKAIAPSVGHGGAISVYGSVILTIKDTYLYKNKADTRENIYTEQQNAQNRPILNLINIHYSDLELNYSTMTNPTNNIDGPESCNICNFESNYDGTCTNRYEEFGVYCDRNSWDVCPSNSMVNSISSNTSNSAQFCSLDCPIESSSTSCVCNAGRYKDANGICKICPEGKYSGSSSNSCLDCAAGRWSGTGATSDQCTICESGRGTLPGMTIGVPPGRWSNYTDVDIRCDICPAGMWSSKSGTVGICTKCVSGKYSTSGEGQISESVCIECIGGKYSTSGEGQISESVCIECAGGKYSTFNYNISRLWYWRI